LPLALEGFDGAGAPASAAGAIPLSIQDGPATLVVAGGDGSLSVEFSKATGALSGWTVGGAQLLAEPMLPCFYRAPTDNDRGGSGGNSFVSRYGQKRAGRGSRPRSSPLSLLPLSHPLPPPVSLPRFFHSPSWKEAGLDRMAVDPASVKLSAKEVDGRVVVSAAFEMQPTDPEIKEAVVGIVGVSEVRGCGGVWGAAFSRPPP
jgi:hypothetical protein